jgi:hypothetical protein
MEPWRVCTPIVADLHNFDEELHPDPHQREFKKDKTFLGEKRFLKTG